MSLNNNDSKLDLGSLVKIPHIPLYEFNYYDQQQQDDEDGFEQNPTCNYLIANSPPNSSSSTSAISCNYDDQPHQESHHSLINFQSGFRPFVDNNNEEISQLHTTSNSDYKQDYSCNGEWFYTDANVADPSPEFGAQQKCFNKRPHEEDDMVTLKKKKQRTPITSKKSAKPKSTSTQKNPQSAIAKNRRERISNKLKILQDLVPNGSKVDLVTMLEKAIGYVKFLQLQMKILATDEFWPSTAGGKAPDISQVREAIDAILSSQRSSSSSI